MALYETFHHKLVPVLVEPHAKKPVIENRAALVGNFGTLVRDAETLFEGKKKAQEVYPGIATRKTCEPAVSQDDFLSQLQAEFGCKLPSIASQSKSNGTGTAEPQSFGNH